MGMNPKIMRPRASGFSPKNVSGLALWYDAADSAQLFSDDAATTLAAADAGVAVMRDKSGAGLHAAQSTSGSRPLRKVAVTNSLDVLRFNGSSSSLAIPNVMLNWPSYSMFIVGKQAASGVHGLVDFTRGSNFSTYMNSGALTAIQRGTNATAGTATYGTFYIFGSEWNGTQVQASINGTAGSAVSVSLPLSGQLFAGSVGKLHDGFFLNGDIGEVLIYSSKLSASAYSAVLSYLKKKWKAY